MIPKCDITVATIKPVIQPTNSEGANTPPTPPGLVVEVEAKILNTTINTKYPTKIQILLDEPATKLFSNTCAIFPFSKASMVL